MPGRLTSRLLWIVFGVTILALAYQFEDRLEMVFTTRGELSVEAQPGRVVLRWRGGIEAPMYARLEEAFRKHSQDTPRFVLSLHSPGGSLQHGRDVIRLIKRVQATHAIDTVIEARRSCASMCVPIYLAGQRRSADPKARFMFHEVSFRDSHSDKVERVPKDAIGRATDQFFARYLKAFGVDERWLAEMREAIRGKDVWRTAEQLIEQRAGVVQMLE